MIVFAHDYETTGVNPKKCGVVQAALCFAKLFDDGNYEVLTKDTVPITAKKSAVAGCKRKIKLLGISLPPVMMATLTQELKIH